MSKQSKNNSNPAADQVAALPKSGINTVQFKLAKEKKYPEKSMDLTPLFDYCSPLELLEAMEHAISVTLLRDQIYAGWAHVWKDLRDDEYYMKITSPNPDDDVREYAELVPNFLEVVAIGRRAFERGMGLEENKNNPRIKSANLRFLPPFGLSMLRAKSVLLLHYPPDETIDYKDYLHSRTTRRWESLLISNGCPGADLSLYESIVDVSPITADGGSVGSAAVHELSATIQGGPALKEPADLNSYVKGMLSLLLRQKAIKDSKRTKPMVAFGAPVRDWLVSDEDRKKDMIEQLKPRPVKKDGNPDIRIQDVFLLEFAKGVKTPVLILDHPCNYYRGGNREQPHIVSKGDENNSGDDTMVYDANGYESIQEFLAYKEETKKKQRDQLRKDLTGARWQIMMSTTPDGDPKKILEEAKKYWDEKNLETKALFDRIARDQVIQFQNIACPVLC
jgi:hypothetical protein